METKKIAFCITCMNRLNHLQQTLEKNIQDNYLPEEVEFVLLDYNSKDGLDEWVKQNMQQYIDTGILGYYKTYDPEYYLRSHSRNMVFRLANAEILCNLDADNFLGKGFAAFMIEEFAKQKFIFYTSDCSFEDIFGRVLMSQKDFYEVRGYNEALNGYGYEDVDFFFRLNKLGLTQKHFWDREFYNVIQHSKAERIADEYMLKNTKRMYISYINPYKSSLLLQLKGFTWEQYTLVDNPHLNTLNDVSTTVSNLSDERNRIIIQRDFQKGNWQQNEDNIIIQDVADEVTFRFDSQKFNYQNKTYYLITDTELKTELIILLTSAINFHKAKKQISENELINPEGFGRGVTYKNFNPNIPVILS